MKNYLEYNYQKQRIILQNGVSDKLKSIKLKGCPFENYTLFDLLIDFVKMYSWKVSGKMSAEDFIRLLQEKKYDKAIAYGNEIIEIVKENKEAA